MTTTVLLVDDNLIFRKGLRFLLEDEEDMRVVGETASSQTAIELLRDLSPDVVVMDVSAPDLDYAETTRRVSSEFPHTSIMVLSTQVEDNLVDPLLRAGAKGYALKGSPPEELLDGIRVVAKGELYLSPAISGVVVSQYVHQLGREPDTNGRFGFGGVDATSLVLTKLHRPRTPMRMVPRPRLFDLLEGGSQRPLTLVCAPAGYGKSTAVSQWLEEHERPSVWLSLDEHDTDLRLFLSYLVMALQTIFPEELQKMSAILDAPVLPPPRVLAGNLTNELEQIAQPVTLVLDDYHAVESVEIRDLLTDLLRHPSHFLHLVLITRAEPDLDLHSLRAGRRMHAIDFSDLRFTASETAAMLQMELGESVGNDIAILFTDKLEGWITGMHLATLAMDSAADLGYMLHGLPGEQFTLDYMLAEVISRQSRAVQEWLLKSAILDRFCAALCEAICTTPDAVKNGELDGTTFVNWLSEQNLFVIPLDAQGRWHRYHHLFRQLLMDQLTNILDAREIAGLHRRAGRWCVDNDLTEEAIGHALAADDMTNAVHLMERYGRDLMSQDQWQHLGNMLDRFSPEAIEAHLQTLTLKAWLLYYQHRPRELARVLTKAESFPASRLPADDRADALLAEIYLINCLVNNRISTGEEMIRYAQHALDRTSPEQIDARGHAVKLQCLAYQRTGDLENALKIAHEAIAVDTPKYAKVRGRMLAILGGIYILEADLPSVQRTAGRCLKHAQKYNLTEIIANARYLYGVSAYEWNNLVSAADHLRSAIEQFHTISGLQAIHSCFFLAATFQSQGKGAEARDVVDAALDYALESAEPLLLPEVEAFQAELALRQGRFAEAIRWARGYRSEQIVAMIYTFSPHLTLAQILVAQNTLESRRRATVVLDKLHSHAASRHDRHLLIKVLALEALLRHAQDDSAGAMQHLNDSLALAEPGGFIRTYVDLGPTMARLLQELAASGVAQDYIAQILDVFVAAPLSAESGGQSKLIESLSDREIEVLSLFDQGLSYNESAQELFVSPNTVKKHAVNAYEKLGVNKKRDAIVKAKALGILQK